MLDKSVSDNFTVGQNPAHLCTSWAEGSLTIFFSTTAPDIEKRKICRLELIVNSPHNRIRDVGLSTEWMLCQKWQTFLQTVIRVQYASFAHITAKKAFW